MALTKTPIELSSTPSIVDGGNATAITIDSSENVTFSGTLNGISTTKSASGNRWGVLPEVESNGVMEVGRYLDFHSTDGDTSDYGARLDFNGTDIVSTNAFQMSSGIYLGGTGADNKLDDYEEGTFTLTWTGTGGTANSTNTQFKYVKVGSLVTIFGNTSSTLPNATGILTLTGLPFINRIETSGSILYRRLTPPSGAHTLVVYIGTNTSTVSPLWSSSGNYTGLDSSQINGNNLQDMYFSISYRTD